MIELMQDIFGQYTLVDGHTNWEYIGAVVLFSIVLVSAFKLLGAVIKR